MLIINFFVSLQVMKHGTKILFLFVIFAISFFYACDREDDYSKIPYISLIEPDGMYKLDSASEFTLKFYFQDGDGNLGFYPGDTFAPYVGEYRNNLHILVYDKDSAGNYNKMTVPQLQLDSVAFNYNINNEYLIPVSKNGSIKGEMQVLLSEIQNCRTYSKTGYVKFRIYMYDRDLNKSNVIFTDEIKVQ